MKTVSPGRHAQRDLIMSELVRWKEYRVRQEIYKEDLKRTGKSTDRVDSGEPSEEELNRISVSFFEQVFGERRERISLVSNT
jgi:heme oxygenase